MLHYLKTIPVPLRNILHEVKISKRSVVLINLELHLNIIGNVIDSILVSMSNQFFKEKVLKEITLFRYWCFIKFEVKYEKIIKK